MFMYIHNTYVCMYLFFSNIASFCSLTESSSIYNNYVNFMYTQRNYIIYMGSIMKLA